MKKMNKFLAVAAAVVLACSLSTAAFAATSEKATDITVNDVKVNASVNDVSGITFQGPLDGPSALKSVTMDEVKANVIALAHMTPDNGNRVVNYAEILRAFEVAPQAGANAAGTKIKITVSNLPGTRLMVMHKDGNTWKLEPIVEQGADYVVIQPSSFSPFALVSFQTNNKPGQGGSNGGTNNGGSNAPAANAPAAAPAAGVPTSPKTGAEFPMASVVAVIALAGAAFCAKKFSVKE